MKQYTVQAPDGKTITLEGPEGASEAEVIAQAQKLYNPQSAEAAPAPPDPSSPEGLRALAASRADRKEGIAPMELLNQATKAFQERQKETAKGLAIEAGTGIVGMGAGALLSKLPSAARAGTKFESVMGKAKDVVLDTTKADEAALRAMELREHGSTLPKVLRDFIKTRESGAPITYKSGRDLASNAGALSSREATAINAKMHRQVSEFAAAMKDANRGAAEKAGVGKLYDEAMKEYRQAKNIEEAGKIVKKWAARLAFTAGLGAAGGLGYELWKSH
jgi:hypothetical protein